MRVCPGAQGIFLQSEPGLRESDRWIWGDSSGRCLSLPDGVDGLADFLRSVRLEGSQPDRGLCKRDQTGAGS